MFSLEPSEYTTTRVVEKLEILIVQVVLNDSVSVMAKCYDSQGGVILEELIHIAGTDYQSWGQDDMYIVNYVLDKLGLQLKTEI